MSMHLRAEVERLKKKILHQGAVVEDDVRKAVWAVDRRDAALAAEVIENDIHIDQTEVEIEEDCLKVLALYQPVAIDLRFIIAILKINNDLERIADLAVNIAERAAYLATRDPVAFPFDFPTMAEKTQTMLTQSLDAMVNLDCDLAEEVCQADDEVDAMNRRMYATVERGIKERPDQADILIHLLSISRHLERIADGATNIAEDVIYMVKGEIVRHRTEDYRAARDGDESAAG